MSHALKKLFWMGLLCLTGCSSVLSPISTPTETKYLIQELPQVTFHQTQQPISIFVSQPECRAAFNTKNMVYVVKPFQINYFVNHSYAELPAAMFRDLITQTLQKTGRYAVNASDIFMNHANIILSSTILTLQQNVLGHSSNFEIAMMVQLSSAKTNTILATHVFTVKTTASTATPDAGIKAANQAAANMMLEIAEFVAAKVTN